MAAPARVAQPGAGWILAIFVMENAFQHKNLLAARMHVRIEVGVRCPAHQCATDAIVFVQRQHAEAGNQATVPLGLPGVKANGFGVAGGELPEFDENGAARPRVRTVRCTRRVTQVGAGRIVSVLIGKNTVQHQNFLPAIVPVRAESRTWRVAHDAGGTANFSTDAIQHAAFNASLRRGRPLCFCGMHDDALREIVMQAGDGLLHG